MYVFQCSRKWGQTLWGVGDALVSSMENVLAALDASQKVWLLKHFVHGVMSNWCVTPDGNNLYRVPCLPSCYQLCAFIMCSSHRAICIGIHKNICVVVFMCTFWGSLSWIKILEIPPPPLHCTGNSADVVISDPDTCTQRCTTVSSNLQIRVAQSLTKTNYIALFWVTSHILDH